MTTADATCTGPTTSTSLTIGGDLPVHRLGFGAMRLTGWGPPADRPAAIRVARLAVELGVTFIDTADSYALGENELLLADALHPYPDGLVVATKAGQSRPDRSSWVPLGRPEYLRQQAELSLRQLRLDRIDLFQLHRIDPAVPLADQIGALEQLRRGGKIRHIGLSEVTVDQLTEAMAITEIASVQNRYNLADREHEDVLDHCERHGLAFIPWLPIANGAHPGQRSELAAVAAELSASVPQVALAWLLRRSPVIVPIPGTSSAEHLTENVAAARLRLTDDQFSRLSGRPPSRRAASRGAPG